MRHFTTEGASEVMKQLIATALLTSLFAAPCLSQTTVTLYSARGLDAGQGGWYHTELAAFTKATGIKVLLVQGDPAAFGGLPSAGSHAPRADVLVTGAPFMQEAEHDKLTLPYISPESAAIPDTLKDDDGDWTALANTDLAFIDKTPASLPAPRGFVDFLTPSYKGKIALPGGGHDIAGNSAMLDLIHVFASQASADGFLNKLRPALAQNGDAEIEAAGLMDLEATGTPGTEIFFPAGPSGEPATIAMPYFIGLLKAGHNPQAARKLVDFLLSKPAQRDLSPLAYAFPVRDDVTPDDTHFKMMTKILSGVTVWTPNWHQARKMLDAPAGG
jgi:2-aminoethylphosphonate transport system substrate-binding protein